MVFSAKKKAQSDGQHKLLICRVGAECEPSKETAGPSPWNIS